MKKVIIVFALTNLLLCNITFADVWTITQLTNDSMPQSWPCISGTNVVWVHYDSSGQEIFSNFAGQLTNNSINDFHPSISGTNVVWYAYDGSDFEIYSNFAGQITNNSIDDYEPSISGTNVVWYGYDGSDFEIYSNFAGQLTNNDTDDTMPSISGTNVVWQGYDGHDDEIYSNFAGQLTNNNDYDRYPAISGTNVVWQGWDQDGADSEIYSNFAGQITDNSTSDIHPSISGTNVVWEIYDTDSEIYSNFAGQITNNGYHDRYPSISGTTVVWYGRTETDSEIFMATFDAVPGADAGPDQSVLVTDTVYLDGSGSSDIGGDPLTFYWSFILMPSGSTTAISGSATITPTFVVDIAGTYEVQLIVNDGTTDSAPDTVIINTLNSAPVANAGPDQTLLVPIGGVAEVILDGSGSTDIDGDDLIYQWTWTTGSTDGASPTIALPVGVHTIELIVNDRTVDSVPDDVVIEVVDATKPLAEKIISVLTDKISLLEQIENANEKELQVYDTLEELLDSGVYTGLARGDMIKAKQKIHSALQHQELAIKKLESSIEKLTDALEPIGVHTIELIVNDRTDDSVPDDVVIEVVDVAEALAEMISTILTDKLDMLEQINTAIETEQVVYDAFEELLASGEFTGLVHGDMVKVKQKIHSALQHQGLAIKHLEKSIENLTDALGFLGSPVEP